MGKAPSSSIPAFTSDEEYKKAKQLSIKRFGFNVDWWSTRFPDDFHLVGFKSAKEFWEVATRKNKKQGLSRTWNSKTKQWMYRYTKRAKKNTVKKQPDTKLSQREEWFLTGEYKIQGKPKEVRKLGKAVTKGVKKTNKATKSKPKIKRKKNIPKDYEVQEVLGVFDMYFHHEYIGTRPTREVAIKYIETHKASQTKPKPKKKKRAKAKSRQRTLFKLC